MYVLYIVVIPRGALQLVARSLGLLLSSFILFLNINGYNKPKEHCCNLCQQTIISKITLRKKEVQDKLEDMISPLL